VLGSISKLWGNITDKNLKVTIQTIEEVIKQQASFVKAGNVTTQDGSVVSVDSSGRAADGTMPIAASKSSTAVADSQPTYNQQREAQIKADAEAAAAAKQKAIEAASVAAANTAANTKARKIADYRANNSWVRSMPDSVIASVLGLAKGGMVPKYFAAGGFSRGTDTVPAMLTPGEFVINKNAANGIGVNNLNKLNSGESLGGSVYNYSVGINVTNANADANDIARAVMGQIKYIDSQRIRGQR
jgi:hypothetical protein